MEVRRMVGGGGPRAAKRGMSGEAEVMKLGDG